MTKHLPRTHHHRSSLHLHTPTWTVAPGQQTCTCQTTCERILPTVNTLRCSALRLHLPSTVMRTKQRQQFRTHREFKVYNYFISLAWQHKRYTRTCSWRNQHPDSPTQEEPFPWAEMSWNVMSECSPPPPRITPKVKIVRINRTPTNY